ncbi:glutamine amidotransferase [Humisphaera borealis]|uniref:Glutamine amidotransferase domain-containing protein n=1 Tax=Humisphaera borealis TaxID=2807512 RepID=A0A7M2WW00_9BACT|nr:glutamine amidotransferase [Humisphaera borealis]QOV89665.1 hypothetical protein IPV69_26335 [Humisphaera borealis]
MPNWSLDITRQSDWDIWSWLCLLAAAALVTHVVATRAWTAPGGWIRLLLAGIGAAGTAAVLGLPGLGNASTGFAWTFVLLTLLSVVACLRLLDRISGKRVATLLALRIAALAALVPMLFEPVLRYVHIPPPQRPLILLVDTSGSMSFPDVPNGPTRLQSVWQRLEPQLGRLSQHFVPQVYRFASNASALSGPQELATVRADGGSTDIVAGIRQSLSNVVRDDATLVVFSDGIDNTTPDIPGAIAGINRRVYTVTVGSEAGDSASPPNVAVADVQADDDLVVGQESKLVATIRSTALPNRVVDVNFAEVDDLGKTIGQVRQVKLVLQPTARGQQVTLPYTPTKIGVQRLAVWVEPTAGERLTIDNRQTLQTLAVDPAIRVLYVEGRLRPEFRDLRRLLETDPNIEAATLLRIQENKFVASGTVNRQKLPARLPTATEWKAFDVILLGDLDASFLSTSDQAAIQQSVSDGKALLMIGGEKAFGPGGYSGTPIENALPVIVGPLSSPQESARFVPRLTADSALHPAMEGLTPFFGIEANPPTIPLPPLNGNVVVAGETGGAQVLLTHPGKVGPDGKPMIVLATQRYGKGRSAALTVHSTYLWALPLHGLGQESPHNRLWGQLIRWLAGTDVRSRQRGAGVDALVNRDAYPSDDPIRIRARVRDSHGDATRFAQVSLKLKRVDANSPASFSEKSYALNPIDSRNGMYELSIPPVGKGDYVASIAATKDGAALGQTEIRLKVIPPADEMHKLAANHPLMRRIAAETNAGSYALDQVPELVDELIRSDTTTRPEQMAIRVGNFAHVVSALAGKPADWPRTYDLPIQALFVIALLTVEWILRRRWQLA